MGEKHSKKLQMWVWEGLDENMSNMLNMNVNSVQHEVYKYMTLITDLNQMTLS